MIFHITASDSKAPFYDSRREHVFFRLDLTVKSIYICEVVACWRKYHDHHDEEIAGLSMSG